MDKVHAELAALSRNAGMKSGLSQETLKPKGHGNPELPRITKDTRECRDFTPAALT